MSAPSALGLHPDRLLPSEPAVRSTARQLYESVKDLPIISPHGHVPPQWLSEDIPFGDPTSLLITPDHYVNRMLHAHGVELSALGVAQATMTEQQSRERRHLVSEMARMACDDGLVMTLHPGVRRNHHLPTFEKYGTDVGTDIPVQMEFTDALRPMLIRYGTNPNFQLVIFTLDETVFSREIGPLAGFYPSVFAGLPWWIIDAPEAIRRYRAAITESAGFAKTSGFIDDTRAFCSIPARHDMSRRLDAGLVAQLVTEHRLNEDEALDVMHALVVTNPRKAFKL